MSLIDLLKGLLKGRHAKGVAFRTPAATGQNKTIITSSALFDAEWYTKTYQISGDPATHYLEEGWKLGFDPSPVFSTHKYLDLYPDVAIAGVNPLLHYESYGKNEGRIAPKTITSAEELEKLKALCSLAKLEKQVRSKEEYLSYVNAFNLVCGNEAERDLTQKCKNSPDGAYLVPGFCEVCGEATEFCVDMCFSTDGAPYWRERMLCSSCGLNSRMRYMVSAVLKEAALFAETPKVYLYEYVTTLFRIIESRLGRDSVTGSEYLSDDLSSGTVVDGILHENGECLSFDDGSFDLVVSCDVFEHVNDYRKCFQEAARVLKPGGKLYMSVPFFVEQDENVQLAAVIDGKLVHYAEPEWHGNPLSSEGSLCFWHYGWAMLDDLKRAGFTDVAMQLYHSHACGYMGNPFIFIAVKD